MFLVYGWRWARGRNYNPMPAVNRDADAGTSGYGDKNCARPRLKARVEQRIRDALVAGHGILKVASIVGVGSGTVQRVGRSRS